MRTFDRILQPNKESEPEKPLDRIVSGGGFASVFRTVAVIGDSLSAGDMETMGKANPRDFHDLYSISWPAYYAAMTGATVYNFSRGNMTASEYCDSYADAMGYWDKSKAAMAYIIALGCNDLDEFKQPAGDLGDIHADCRLNNATFAGHYSKVIQRYKDVQPDAAFFLVTIPRDLEELEKPEFAANHDRHRELLYSLADKFTNTYVIDLREYAPFYGDDFRKAFFVGGHMNSQGYYLTAKMICSFIDYIVRHNPDKLRLAGYAGTGLSYV
ncbi:MAG: SGNH/GDSL hydrolase family protein [Clostridia bacterium]|nr:SGNH/GDSL hydrolase family protein [Clostridia bacterium]